MTENLIHGIDFSGNVRMWTPGCGRSNVWIATARLGANQPELLKLGSVQELPGEVHPFDRLAKLFADANYLAAAIDAPFSLPARHMPKGGFPALLKAVNAFEKGGRPFAKAEELVRYAESIKPKKEKKPLRETENSGQALMFDQHCGTARGPERPSLPPALLCSPRRSGRFGLGPKMGPDYSWKPSQQGNSVVWDCLIAVMRMEHQPDARFSKGSATESFCPLRYALSVWTTRTRWTLRYASSRLSRRRVAQRPARIEKQRKPKAGSPFILLNIPI